MLNVVFSENDSRRRQKYAKENFYTISKIALTLFSNDITLKKKKKEKRLATALEVSYREKFTESLNMFALTESTVWACSIDKFDKARLRSLFNSIKLNAILTISNWERRTENLEKTFSLNGSDSRFIN